MASVRDNCHSSIIMINFDRVLTRERENEWMNQSSPTSQQASSPPSPAHPNQIETIDEFQSECLRGPSCLCRRCFWPNFQMESSSWTPRVYASWQCTSTCLLLNFKVQVKNFFVERIFGFFSSSVLGSSSWTLISIRVRFAIESRKKVKEGSG